MVEVSRTIGASAAMLAGVTLIAYGVIGLVLLVVAMAGSWRNSEGSTIPRVRGRELQRRRAALFARHRWCVLCPTRGQIPAHRATIRDHTIPLAEGGRDDATNEQAICQTCSDLKTREESARGVRRR